MDCKEFVSGGLPNDCLEETAEISVRFSESAGGQMGGQWQLTCGRLKFLLQS
jgi:hypothetical protein